jgi:hypothetical protein
MSRPDFPQGNNVAAWLVLGYLCSHPDAKDTAVGVAEWWLRDQGIEVDKETVRVALEYLVKQRWIVSTAGHSGSQIYGLNPERKTVLQQFLKSQSTFH